MALIRYLFLWLLLFPVSLLAQVRETISPTALEAERRSALIRILRERQIPFEERSLFAAFGGFSSSVHVAIPGSDTPQFDTPVTTLVLGIPLSNTEDRDNRPLGSQFPFGLEIGLAFIEDLRVRGSPMDILVAFLGDEISRLPRAHQKESHRGLEDLYTVLPEPENTILLYLDIRDTPQSLLVHHGANKTITPLSELKPLYTLCNSRNIPLSFASRFNELYKFGLLEGHPVMQSAHTQNMNALYVTGTGMGASAKTEDEGDGPPGIVKEDLAGLLVDYAHALGESRENPDYHFLILNILGNYIFISELITVITFFIIMGAGFLIILIYSGVYRRILLIQWNIFSRYIWFFALLLVLPFATLWLAGSLISQVAYFFRVSPLLKPLGMAGFKITVALLLFSWVFVLPGIVKIPRKWNLYGNTAVLLVTLGVLIGSLLDITFIPIFIWVFLFTFLGATIKIPILVYLCALITPLLAFGPLFDMAEDKGLPLKGLFSLLENLLFSTGRLTEIILSQNILSFLYIVVIATPCILLFERGIALAQRRKTPPPPFRRILFSLAVLAITFGGLVYYTYTLSRIPPGDSEMPQGDPEFLHIQYRGETFLERRSITITIEARGSPLRFNLYLLTEEETPPVIYSAPMPFIVRTDQGSVEFILGEGPPNPFSTEIVLPLDFSGFLRVEAIYPSWDSGVDTPPSPEKKDYFLEVCKTIPLLH